MPRFQIEMLWDCAVCKATLNRGLERHCRNCGHAKDEQDPEYMPENVTLKDALDGDKKRRAEAGKDWKCGYCGSLQNQLNKCCTECGVPQGQTGAKKAWDTNDERATFDPFSGVKESSRRSPPDVTPPPTSQPSTPIKARVAGPPPRLSTPRFLKRALIAVPCIALAGVLLWLIFRTKVVSANVASESWTHAVKIDRYQLWHREGWTPDFSAVNVHDQGPRVHHYDHVRVGSHKERVTSASQCGETCTTVKGACHTTKVTCTKNKNGTANCSGGDKECDPDTKNCDPKTCSVSIDDYEDQPRYQDYYDWDVWDWGYNRTVTHTGADTIESWPSPAELQPAHLALGEQEREAGRSMNHKVTFIDGKGGSWDITPDTCQEFERFPVGRSVKLKVGVAHGVEVLP